MNLVYGVLGDRSISAVQMWGLWETVSTLTLDVPLASFATTARVELIRGKLASATCLLIRIEKKKNPERIVVESGRSSNGPEALFVPLVLFQKSKQNADRTRLKKNQ
eukprot:669950-Rhodomonas_salina.1